MPYRRAFAATDVRVNFVLNTTDANGIPIQQDRYYLIYRPDNLSKTTPVPMILAMDDGTLWHGKADQSGLVVVSASSTGNSSGTGFNNDNPSITGYEDYDYLTEVITPITYKASPLPAGLSVDPDSGIISGIPAETGTTTVTLEAANPAGHASALLTPTVTDTPPPVTIDQWRQANFGASAIDPSIAGNEADPDGDGYTNYDEFRFGSNPLDSTSIPAPPVFGAKPRPRAPLPPKHSRE